MMTALCHDALIAGGGPAGAMLATLLAEEGRQCVLIERSRQPEHKVCGEFLSPESLTILRRIDISPEHLGARAIHSLRLVTRDVIAETRLPAAALSLTRKALDEALLRRAQSAGVNLLRGYTVNRLMPIQNEDGATNWRAHISDRTSSSLSILGRDAFLATGKHDLHNWPRSPQGTHSSLVAMKMYFTLTPEQRASLDGHIELIFYPGGYAGLQSVEGNSVNLCALISQKKLRALGGRWSHLLDHMLHHSPHLAKRLSDARPLLARPLAISSIPYGYCAPIEEADAPWRLGDQSAVIPSFCGDGIAMALHSASRAAELSFSGASPSALQAEIQHHFQPRLHWTSTLSQLLVAMPSLVEAVRLWPPILPWLFSATRVPSFAKEIRRCA